MKEEWRKDRIEFRGRKEIAWIAEVSPSERISRNYPQLEKAEGVVALSRYPKEVWQAHMWVGGDYQLDGAYQCVWSIC